MKSLLTFFVVIFMSLPVFAQDTSSSHYKAAEEMLISMNLPTMLDQSIESMIDAQTRHNPMMAAFEDIFRTFFHNHMSWKNLKDVYVQMYMDEFTENELREITAFYQSEVGQKAVNVAPLLMQKGMMIGEEIVTENLPELERMLDKRMMELEGN